MCARPVRRSQAIAPFGVGAIVDFPGPVSLVHAGLDVWPFNEQNPDHREFKIVDELRLAKRLGVKYFVQPPDYRRPPGRGQSSQQINLSLRLPFLRFPRWHFCPRCGLMKEAALHDRSGPNCVGPIATGKSKGSMHKQRRMIQVRFVAACSQGHMRDFPWWDWVFKGSAPDTSGLRLRLHSSGSASLAGVTVVCERDIAAIDVVAKRPLTGVFGSSEDGSQNALSQVGVVCKGENPVIGLNPAPSDHTACGELLNVLIRGSSNLYFPQTVSSIYIPPIREDVDENILEVLEDQSVWVALTMLAAVNDDKLDENSVSVVLKKYYPHLDLDIEVVTRLANQKLTDDSEAADADSAGDGTEEAYRKREYVVLRRRVQTGYPKTDLVVEPQTVGDYEEFLGEWLGRISLVPKLRETRAFVGFSRVRPQEPRTHSEMFELISREPKDWIPAVVVRGEGLFLELDSGRLSNWHEVHHEFIDQRVKRVNSISRISGKNVDMAARVSMPTS